MYSLAGYAEMIADRVRTGAYAQALRQTVRPESVVLEIGTGPGILSILACQLGARRVIAIESEEIIQVARENAAANGCAGRIEFIEDFSTRITLDVRADIIVSDLHGILPLYGLAMPSIADARRRLLAPGGILIPRKETLWAAVVELPKDYSAIVGPWERNILDQHLEPARRLVVNGVQKARAKPEQLLTAPRLWAMLDYSTLESPDVRNELQWTVERAGTGHGIVVWFDSDLGDGVSFSNAPGAPEMIYGSLFFAWIRPVTLEVGENICVQLEAKLTSNDYVWRWDTQVSSTNNSGSPREQFHQSMLAGSILSPGQLRKSSSSHVPQLTHDGQVDRRALELMDGKATLEEIARHLATEFPNRFARWEDALSCVGLLSRKYSR